ncbi:glutathione synthetase [Parastagonospora nodorum]|nr:glutathione synthetase [Parastagonospora nodorum]KAH3976416.1 glutathione synthetase [Parastagonospora nodorum]KAH3984591.1 glutathione synthetase [Parastagonospora nodorum]KAH4000660.1 glutathione synthetase [Parastagonospora nodorum]KAH4026736.1 glutathione synthetase [Parastagonospora nodorum]
MASAAKTEYPPEISKEEEHYLLSNLKDWSIAHGLAVRPAPSFVQPSQDPSGVLASTAPVTLFPSLFPKSCFEDGLVIQKAYNELYSAIARDEAWLQSIVEELVDIDDFVAKLWQTHLAVKKEGYVQELSLGLFRSDYMVHKDPTHSDPAPGLKQVEFNTIASSFGGLSSQVSALHKYLLTIDAYPASATSIIKENALRQSKSASSLAQGLATAHKAYGASKTSRPLCVLFVVQDPERNVFDQRHLEYALLEQNGVRSFRLPFGETLVHTKLDGDRTLVYTPPNSPSTTYEVTTIYFRAGYSPDDYPKEEDWAARLHLEKSRAIKCPSILTHLAGCKKVQQVLATPHSPHLKRFLPDPAVAERVLATFAPIYPLDDSEAGKEARKHATDPSSASRYVLKPQREGGGNNIYRKAIPPFLEKLPETHWPAYILMEMIEPPPLTNAVLRNGELQRGGVICELGVYGVCLWKDRSGSDSKGEILENWEAGYLLRTKGDQSEEGGVAAGFGAVDSVCLVD